MASPFNQLKYATGIAAYASVYGIACLLVYYVGPAVGISLPYQIVLIAVILVTLPFVLVIEFYRKRRATKKEAAENEAAAADTVGKKDRPATGAATGTYDELTRKTEEAVQWLRNSKLATTKSGDAVYSLPWFVVAGTPSSGKTSLLLSAGLDFQTLPSQRRADENIIRPTPDCEWRVTDWAMLVDTAGRYQSEGPDADEWSGLLETLKKYRQDRPVDGLLIPVNAARILKLGEAEIEQQAKILRARLDEVITRTGVKFPVYLIFTNLDTVEGFEDFFRLFSVSERAQVWGATIPLEQSPNAHALFDVEFDYLYDALMRRRLIRLSAPDAPLEQLMTFRFPLEFNAVRRKLGQFTSALFRPNPFSESPLMRGFYFTSSGRSDKPIKPKTALPPKVEAAAPTQNLTLPVTVKSQGTGGPSSLKDEGDDTGDLTSAKEKVQVAGESYFSGLLFKDVLQRDANLAASFQAKKKDPNRLRNILIGISGVVLFLFTVLTVISYFGNRALINEATERGARVDEIYRADVGKDPLKKEATAARVEVEAVESLRETVAQLDDYDRHSPPLYLRFGLYAGNDINPSLRTIYFDSITQRYFKPLRAAVERDLQAFISGSDQNSTTSADAAVTPVSTASRPEEELGRYYDLLKAYLMLGMPDRVEPTFLANKLADYWKKSSPPDMEIVSQQQLEFYARQADRDDAPHLKIDDKLVDAARRKLVAYPAVNRFFKQLTSEVDAKVAAVSLDGVVQGRGRGILAGSYAVPGSFTLRGYRDFMRERLEKAGEEISKDDWVMGSVAATQKDQSADVSKLQALYFREYTDQWRKFLRGIAVRSFKTKDDAVEAFKALSATDSPMELIMIEVDRNTALSAEPKKSGFFGWIGSWFSSKPQVGPGATEVEKEFRPLSQFVGSDRKDSSDSSPLSQYRAAFKRILDTIETKSDDQFAQTSKALLTDKDDIGLKKTELEIDRLLDAFKTAAAADTRSVLKQPLDNLRALIYGGGYEQIEKGWREQLYPQATRIEAGFPFTDSGETPLTDLARYLNPANGQLTLFFNDKLASSFDDAQGQWKLKESGAFRFNNDFVNYLNNARRLRDALFANGGQQPEVNYEITLQTVTGADVVVEVDGNKVETRGTAPQSAKFIWPAKAGASGARIAVIKDGQQSEKTFPGEWGLFKMFAAGSPTKTADNQFALTFNVGAATVRATLRPSSATNPFQRSLFTQMRAPQNLK